MMKLALAFALLIIPIYFNQVFGQPPYGSLERPILVKVDSTIIMQNNWISVVISMKTGEISTFYYYSATGARNLLTDTAYITFWDKKDPNQPVEYRQSAGKIANIDTISYPPDSVRAVFDLNFGLPPPAEYPYSIRIIYSLDSQAFHWDAELRTGLTPDREANIDFSFPVIANMDYAFWTKDNAPFKLPINRTIQYRKLYDVWTVIPTIMLYTDTANIGLSFVSPFEVKKPGLQWKIEDSSFIISNYYLRLSEYHPAHSAVYIVPHEADWRPGLAWIYDKYPSYFNPVSESVIKGEGWYGLVDERPGPVYFEHLRQYGVKWVEFYAHNPFFGVYAPPDKNKWIIIYEDNDTMSYEHWTNDFRINSWRHTSYDSNSNKIDYLHNDSIQTYLYFESFESWKQYANFAFFDQFAKDANGDPLPAWRQCYLMNPDIDGDWGKHIDSQVTALLDNYPKMNGIFYDRDDYCDYDYNHNDSVTMIGSRTAYMLGFAQEKINDTLLKIVHCYKDSTKGVWTNGPTSVEVCDSMDGIMSEAPYQAPCLQYLGINRPLIYLPYDITPQQTEEKLKTALWTGHFPSIASFGADSQCIDLDTSRYRPLFSLYKGKKWVLYPHALQLPEGTKGNIFQTSAPDSDYLIAMIDPDRFTSKVYLDTARDIFRYDRFPKIHVPDSLALKYCYLLSGDYKGINQDTIYRDNGIFIKTPAHRVSSLIQLSKEPRYEITRTSSPVLTRGDTEKFEVKIQNINEEESTYYDILLKTPSDSISYTFYLQHNYIKKVGLNFVVSRNFPLGETTMKVILRSPRNDTIVFTSWVVNLLTFQLLETLFIHSGKWGDTITISTLSDDTIPFILVNNTNRPLVVRLTGSFVSGSGQVKFGLPPFQTTQIVGLNPLQDTELVVYIAADSEGGTIRIQGEVMVDSRKVYAIRPVLKSMIPDTLHDFFDDDFSSGNMNKWQIIPPQGAWTVHNQIARGDSDRHLAFKYGNWDNYKFQVNTKLGSSTNPLVDWIKSFIYFRVKDTLNYYRFGLAQGFKAISLWKRDTTWSLLANCDFDVKKDVWYNLRAEVIGDRIKCFLDGNQVISVRDSLHPFLSGGIGIGVTEDAYVNYYDDVVVRRITR
jgi:hypothetical protein